MSLATASKARRASPYSPRKGRSTRSARGGMGPAAPDSPLAASSTVLICELPAESAESCELERSEEAVSPGSAGGRVLARSFRGGVSVIVRPPGEGGETIAVGGAGRSGRPARKGGSGSAELAREVARSNACGRPRARRVIIVESKRPVFNLPQLKSALEAASFTDDDGQEMRIHAQIVR